VSEVDESVLRNLDTQHRRLAELEDGIDRLPAGDTTVSPSPAPEQPQRYEQLTATNDALRAERGWNVVDLDAALTPALRAEFEQWRARQRIRWALDDVVAVAVAGLIGTAATWFDSAIDAAVRDQLKRLKDTELIRGWERDARRMPIDYTGPHFGGRAHRVRSPGHDIGRPFEALRQIRDGEFRGFYWEDRQRFEKTESYRPVESLGEALTLWGKHLVADAVTPMSLPLPGWTKLYELPSRQLRIFAHQAYSNSVNLRSATLSTLPVLSTEAVIRTHVHGRAMLARGSAVLEPAEQSLRAELLLAGHSLVGAASLGKTLTLALAASPVAAFGHINWPVLMRAAMLSLQVVADARARRSTARSWDELLTDLAAPWQYDTADELDRALAR
jgi:hypothetical protein